MSDLNHSDTPVNLVLLAAGQGSRMRSDLPKVLHQVAGLPLYGHALRGANELEPSRTVIVTGHGAEQVEASVALHAPEATCVRQEEQLGTGHAVDQARAQLQEATGDTIVLYGDTPFVEGETLQAMLDARRSSADVVVLGFEAAEPGRYGRLITKGDQLFAIREAKDASETELAITLCNSGVICADTKTLFELLSKVGNENASGEYYLTDIVGLAVETGLKAQVVVCDEAETMGVNTRMDLAAAEMTFQNRCRYGAMESGVTLQSPETTFFSHDTYLGSDVVIEPHVVFGPNVTVENDALIRAFSHLEGCHVSSGCIVGPYARLRPGAELDRGVKIGNFVEVKESSLQEGAKVNHLSYIGDAEIGPEANIGAGTITCNYDGVMKHKTTIGARAFIGSNSSLVAPVAIGDDAMTGSGSVITKDVPNGDLAIARSPQENKKGLARRLMDRLQAIKANKKA